MCSKNRYCSKCPSIFHHFFTKIPYSSKYPHIFHHFFTENQYRSKYSRIFHHFFTISRYLSKNPRITLEYQVRWIVSSFIFDIFLHIIDCIFHSVGLPLLGLSNKLPVSNHLLLQALIMRCSGGSISYNTRSLSLTSFLACLVWSLPMKNEAAQTLYSTA